MTDFRASDTARGGVKQFRWGLAPKEMPVALRGKKPEAVEKRLKAMFYGPAGAGKTMAAIQFPRPYLIDTERGAENEEYAAALKKSGGLIFQTTDFAEMLSEVQSLLTDQHEFRTVIIDPITTVYNDLLDTAAKNPKIGTEFGRHYGEANKQMKHLLNLLLRLDMNVIVTCHAKNEYGDGMKVVAQTFDGYKKLDYLFDLVFELARRGKERVGIVRKTRVAAFPEGDVFPFSYTEIAKRYGADVLESAASPVRLASKEQAAQLRHIFDVLVRNEQLTADTVERWLTKHRAETVDEVDAETVEAAIKHYSAKVESLTKGAA